MKFFEAYEDLKKEQMTKVKKNNQRKVRTARA